MLLGDFGFFNYANSKIGYTYCKKVFSFLIKFNIQLKKKKHEQQKYTWTQKIHMI